jgi:light-regulated signal transduction histidine kinase (bacteriophytochrome)
VSQFNPAAPFHPTERQDRWISDEDLSQFLLRACHDLRNPVRAVRAHAELIRKSPGTADFAQHLDFIVEGARKIDLLTDSLTSYSIALHIEPASFQPTRMDIALRNALARLAGELRDRAAEVICGELPCVSGNPDRLGQVFEKLLQNALRHSGRSSPRINVTATQQADEWVFAIRDDGCGIDADYLERIFKPFERLHSERDGVGMGLAICRAIVVRHSGRLWAESTPGTGSTFFFTLPVVTR